MISVVCESVDFYIVKYCTGCSDTVNYIEVKACGLKPYDMKYIGERGGRTYFIPNSI